MGPAVTGQLGGQRVGHHHVTRGAGALGLQLHTAPTGGGEDVALEAAALRLPAGHVVGEVLALPAGPGGLLLEALVQSRPVVSLPLLPAVAAGPALSRVEVEEFSPLTGALGELPVAPLVRRPPVPVVEPLAVFLLLTEPPGRSLPEDEPLPEAAGSPGVGLVTLPLRGQGVARQTPAGNYSAGYQGRGGAGLVLPALCLEGVHGPHKARRPGIALLHVDAGPRGVELVAGPVLLIEDKSLLALALRGLGGVVEGEVVPGRTGTSGIELVTLRNSSNTHHPPLVNQTTNIALENILKLSENI